MKAYKSLAKILSPLLAWLAVGWMLFPTLALSLSKAIGEPLEAGRLGIIGYPLSLACFGFSALLWWYSHRF